jgi:hypothetical protein
MWGKSGLGSSQGLVDSAFEKMRTQGGGKDSVPLHLVIDSFNAKALPKVRGDTAAEREGERCKHVCMSARLTPWPPLYMSKSLALLVYV